MLKILDLDIIKFILNKRRLISMIKIIDFETCRKIGNKLSSQEYLEWIETALKNKPNFVMPPKTNLQQDNGGYFHAMPCLYEDENVACVKMIGRHLLKPNEKRSVMMADLLLYESDTGILKGLLDAEYITTLRTGAAAAHSVLMYAKKEFKTIGLFGLGNIMFTCIEILMSEIKNREVIFKLYKYHNNEEKFMERFSKYENIQFELCDTYEQTVRGSDVIISAVTNTTQDFANDDCYEEGCTVIPIMTLGFQNCDLFFDKVFADDVNQIRGFKYFDKFKSITSNTEVLLGESKGRENDKERILVYNYGLAVHDLYFALQFYNNSLGLEKDVEYDYCKEKFFM